MTKDLVRVFERDVKLPTYEVGEAEKNPMFLEKRVYQGSSGRVYPHPIIESIADEKTDKTYRMIILENEYLYIELMPEIGGRVYRALDKTNKYDFVYYNKVIKPALVGLAGPWISGGIEFNWPQHHRPNTFGPVEYTIEENDDGSKTVWMSEIDRMYGTKGMAGFTLYSGKAYLEITGQLYNRTPHPQTFLWWANPAIPVNNHTQSIFPPDVNAVFDHGKRDVSKFPIATGTYYKMDYSSGVDISRYKNIPVPTSYMVYKSDYNFVGGYDYSVGAGILHVANRHISPGKKQWTWGSGDFGKAWDRNLTDEDGPYVELMTGVYTDNQPDFTWLQPYEEKRFRQYFMPYKKVGEIKNASIDAAVNLEFKDSKAEITVYTTAVFEQAKVVLRREGTVDQEFTVSLSPEKPFTTIVNVDAEMEDYKYSVSVLSKNGEELISYQPEPESIEKIPEAAKAIDEPEELKNNEALFLAGQHLEQYRHATFEPDGYYLEGLKRDPEDSRINNAYGLLLLRRGLFKESEGYFRKAIETITRHNPNPYDTEPYYHLGVCLKLQGRLEEAFAYFYKAIWAGNWQDKAYFALAQISCYKKEYKEALELVDASLDSNRKNILAWNLKAAVLRKLGLLDKAVKVALESIELDVLDFGARNELYLTYLEKGLETEAKEVMEELERIMRDCPHNYISLCQDYLASGQFEEAIKVLKRYTSKNKKSYPMAYYYLAYLYQQLDRNDKAEFMLGKASVMPSDYCFPNQLLDYIVLDDSLKRNPTDARAHYYVGNLLYDKKRYSDATKHWEESIAIDESFPTAHRNLAFSYFNKMADSRRAGKSLEIAFELNKKDARVFYELDQLYKKVGVSPEDRFNKLDSHFDLVEQRDDLYVEYVTLLNTFKRHKEALQLINKRNFHPWEGGEGKITSQYVQSKVGIALGLIETGQFDDAIYHLKEAKEYPENLGEGKLYGAQENNIHYFLGVAYHKLGDDKAANNYWLRASTGLSEPASAMYYNDQPPEMIFYQGMALKKLGREKEARSRFNKLIDYGESHLFEELTIDYFAVSLPDFLVFDEDMERKNKVHCHFMMGLGYLGLGKEDQSRKDFNLVLDMEPAHQQARVHKEFLKREKLVLG
ncbi:DUF5107 domain-containing protein [Gracilibacillus sp. YIM 98692]|uniref:DUF5107 domain-containing protein n=1 Tax=Gracilibacillus sp. YIM 98692 TaxID=2663532 RepID=UPI001F099E0D|nr:DUF5107 domain-containing protein [Gracilibacillus sp. YIM 98692]